MPFDVYTDRSLIYHIEEGKTDPVHLEADKKKLGQFALETMGAWHGRKVSPVYHLLPYLQEPDWKSLQIEQAGEVWSPFDEWSKYIEAARRERRVGDILVLADEAPTWALRLESHRTVGQALLQMGRTSLALVEYEKALDIDSQDLESRQKKGHILTQMKRHHQARIWIDSIVKDYPGTPDNLALLGRVEKDAWVDAWDVPSWPAKKKRQEAVLELARLQSAIKCYKEGFLEDPKHYYSGLNAVTLLYLKADLLGDAKPGKLCRRMEGGLRWAIRCALAKNERDYWTKISQADLCLLRGKKEVIEQKYRAALALANQNLSALRSSRNQLLLLKKLQFRLPEVNAILKLFDRELKKLEKPKESWQPSQVCLFSGHMIDCPTRKEARFPSDKEGLAAQSIQKEFDDLKLGQGDLAISSGACGGDLLFIEAALERGCYVQIFLPFDENTFIKHSIIFSGEGWVSRYYKAKEHPNSEIFLMPEWLGKPPKDRDPYARNNLWMLNHSMSFGPEKLHFVCLWNRQGGDGPGGTQDMFDTVIRHAGRSRIIDTNKLW